MGVNSALSRSIGLRCLFIFHRSGGPSAHQYIEETKCKFSSSTKSVGLAFSVVEKEQQNSESPAVVIMHGLMGSRGNWNSISKAINYKIKRKVYAVDARNHGDSPHTSEMTYSHMVEDLRTFLKAKNLGRVSAVGHSMGGRTMMLLALTYPELVEKLIVVDISPVGTSPSLNEIKKYLETMNQIKFGDNIPLSAARRLVDQELTSVVLSPAVRQFLVMNITQTENGHVKWRVNLDTILRNFEEIASFPATDRTFKGPTYFIGGGNSNYIRQDDEPEIKKLFPSAVFEYIPGAGHWVHSEKPTEFVAAVCKFLTG